MKLGATAASPVTRRRSARIANLSQVAEESASESEKQAKSIVVECESTDEDAEGEEVNLDLEDNVSYCDGESDSDESVVLDYSPIAPRKTSEHDNSSTSRLPHSTPINAHKEPPVKVAPIFMQRFRNEFTSPMEGKGKHSKKKRSGKASVLNRKKNDKKPASTCK